jgi:hypothetical protein
VEVALRVLLFFKPNVPSLAPQSGRWLPPGRIRSAPLRAAHAGVFEGISDVMNWRESLTEGLMFFQKEGGKANRMAELRHGRLILAAGSGLSSNQ